METSARVGRNDPCPCGSGKKHKNCCAQHVEAVAEAKRSPGLVVGMVVVGLGLAGVVAAKFLGQDEPSTTTNTTTGAPVTAPPVTFTPNSSAPGFTPQPPGPVPPGKVWSAEHGHWHDLPGANASVTPIISGVDGQLTPIPAPEGHATSPGTPQPPGPPPAGKVWSVEHGHWHDVPGASAGNTITPVITGADGQLTPIPAPEAHPTSPGTPQPPGPPPAGKVWSTEHGHWHDAPSGGTVVPQ